MNTNNTILNELTEEIEQTKQTIKKYGRNSREALWNQGILGGFLTFYFFKRPFKKRKIRSLNKNISIK